MLPEEHRAMWQPKDQAEAKVPTKRRNREGETRQAFPDNVEEGTKKSRGRVSTGDRNRYDLDTALKDALVETPIRQTQTNARKLTGHCQMAVSNTFLFLNYFASLGK